MSPDRREYTRFDLPSGTLAFDDQGRRVGSIERAGGGGLQLRLEEDSSARAMQPGDKLRLVVVNSSGERHELPLVEVRFVQQDTMGVQFVMGEPMPPADS